MRFGIVPASHWPDGRHLILPALECGREHDEADVVAALENGAAQLWLGIDDQVRCAVVTRLNQTARGLVCEIWLMGGVDRRLWLHFLADIEQAAKAAGCVAVELIGRAGWARLLPDYKRTAVVLEKVL